MKSNRLGRGLEALIPDVSEGERPKDSALSEIEISRIRANPQQPRKEFDRESMEELKQSILANGIIQPITVRSVENGYEIIAGERRLRAVRELGFDRVPAYVMQVRSGDQMLELALVENIQREDLNPMELAKAYRQLLTEYNLTQEDVAKKVGKDRATIANFIRLLKLPQPIQDSLFKDEISMGHAKCFMSLTTQSAQIQVWKKTVKQGWSVRKLEEVVREMEEPPGKKGEEKPRLPAYYKEAEDRIRGIMATQVRIRKSGKGGKIEVVFFGDEDLQRLLDLFETIS